MCPRYQSYTSSTILENGAIINSCVYRSIPRVSEDVFKTTETSRQWTFNNDGNESYVDRNHRQHRRGGLTAPSTSAIFRGAQRGKKMYINSVINKRINTYMAWCLAQPADWWVASAWASPSTLQQKKGAAGHKVRLLSYGEEIRGQFERARPALRGIFIRTSALHLVAWRDAARGEAARSWNPPVSRQYLAPISVGFPRKSRDSRESSSRGARCFYKNRGDQSRSLAPTSRRGSFPAALFFLRISCTSFWSF